MSGAVVIVGDRDADPLVSATEVELAGGGVTPLVLSPASLAGARLSCGADWCAVDGAPVGAVVFRASPSLLVAPEFSEDDAGFAASELRAVWAHLLATPGVAAVNRAYADTWFSSSEWSFWRRHLAARGIPVAPRRIGRPYGDGRWVRWTGGDEPAPDPLAAERLGAATVACGAPTRVLCCAGSVVDGGQDASSLAGALLDVGLVLAAAVLDDEGRLVTVETLPVITPAQAGGVAARLTEWIGAALDR